MPNLAGCLIIIASRKPSGDSRLATLAWWELT